MDAHYTLGDVWMAMQSSDSFIIQVAGHLNEMMNTSGIFLFCWYLLFMMIIPFTISRFFKKKRVFIYIIAFVFSFFLMQEIENYMTTRVHQQIDKLEKENKTILKRKRLFVLS